MATENSSNAEAPMTWTPAYSDESTTASFDEDVAASTKRTPKFRDAPEITFLFDDEDDDDDDSDSDSDSDNRSTSDVRVDLEEANENERDANKVEPEIRWDADAEKRKRLESTDSTNSQLSSDAIETNANVSDAVVTDADPSNAIVTDVNATEASDPENDDDMTKSDSMIKIDVIKNETTLDERKTDTEKSDTITAETFQDNFPTHATNPFRAVDLPETLVSDLNEDETSPPSTPPPLPTSSPPRLTPPEPADGVAPGSDADARVNVLAMIRLIESRGLAEAEDVESDEESGVDEPAPEDGDTTEATLEAPIKTLATLASASDQVHSSKDIESSDEELCLLSEKQKPESSNSSNSIDQTVPPSHGVTPIAPRTSAVDEEDAQPLPPSSRNAPSPLVLAESVPVVIMEPRPALPLQIINALDGIKEVKAQGIEGSLLDNRRGEHSRLSSTDSSEEEASNLSKVGLVSGLESASLDPQGREEASPLPDLELVYDPPPKDEVHIAAVEENVNVENITASKVRKKDGKICNQVLDEGMETNKIHENKSEVTIGSGHELINLAENSCTCKAVDDEDDVINDQRTKDSEIKHFSPKDTSDQNFLHLDQNGSKSDPGEIKDLDNNITEQSNNILSQSLANHIELTNSNYLRENPVTLKSNSTLEQFLLSNEMANDNGARDETTFSHIGESFGQDGLYLNELPDDLSKNCDNRIITQPTLKSKLISLESIQYNQDSPDSGIMETSSNSSSGNSESSPSLVDQETFAKTDRTSPKFLSSKTSSLEVATESPIYSAVSKSDRLIDKKATEGNRNLSSQVSNKQASNEDRKQDITGSKHATQSKVKMSNELKGSSYLKYIDEKAIITSPFLNNVNDIRLNAEVPASAAPTLSNGSNKVSSDPQKILKSCCKSAFKSSSKKSVKFSVDYGKPTEVLEFYADDSSDDNMDPLVMVSNSHVLPSQRQKSEMEMIESLKAENFNDTNNFGDEFMITSLATAPLLQSSTMRAMIDNKISYENNSTKNNFQYTENNEHQHCYPKENEELSLFPQSVLDNVGQQNGRTKLSIEAYTNPRSKLKEKDYSKEEIDLMHKLLNLDCEPSLQNLAKLKAFTKDHLLDLQPKKPSNSQSLPVQDHENIENESLKTNLQEKASNINESVPKEDMSSQNANSKLHSEIPQIPRLRVEEDGSLTASSQASSGIKSSKVSNTTETEPSAKGDIYSEAFEACLDNVSIGYSVSDSESSPEGQDSQAGELESFVQEGQRRLERLKKTRDPVTGSPAVTSSKKLTVANRIPSDSDISTLVERERKAEILKVLSESKQSYGTLKLPSQSNISPKIFKNQIQSKPGQQIYSQKQSAQERLQVRPHSLGNSPTHLQLMPNSLSIIPQNSQSSYVRMTDPRQSLPMHNNQVVAVTASSGKQHSKSLSAGPSRPKMLRRVLPLPAQALLQQGGRSRSQTLPHPGTKPQPKQQNNFNFQRPMMQNDRFLSLTPQQKQQFLSENQRQNTQNAQYQGDYILVPQRPPNPRSQSPRWTLSPQRQGQMRQTAPPQLSYYQNPINTQRGPVSTQQQVMKRASLHSVNDLYRKHGQDGLQYQMLLKQRPHSFYSSSGTNSPIFAEIDQPVYAELSTFNSVNTSDEGAAAILKAIPEPDYPGGAASQVASSNNLSLFSMPSSHESVSLASFKPQTNNSVDSLTTTKSQVMTTSISSPIKTNAMRSQTNSAALNTNCASPAKTFEKRAFQSSRNETKQVNENKSDQKVKVDLEQSPKRAATPPKPPPRSVTPPSSLPNNGAPEIYYTMDI